MPQLQFRILGCGSSGGVPRIGGHWGSCDPANIKNRRTRCSLLIQLIDGNAVTRVLVDSSPDLRQQLLDAGVGELDGVVYTHAHADHVNGLDDLRVVFLNRGSRLPAWADEQTRTQLLRRFSYAFIQEEGSAYPSIMDLRSMGSEVVIAGAAGEITLQRFPVVHGDMYSNGLRIGNLAYIPDVSDIDEESWHHLANLDCLILDALRRKPHPTHIHLSKSLEWIEKVQPRRAILTNLHNDLDYETLLAESPANVEPAYDGLTISYGK